MPRLLAFIISYAISGFFIKLFTTLGIAMLTYQGLSALVEGFLDLIEPMTSGLPEYILNILAIAGVPEGLTIISSAVLTRAAIQAARVWVGAIG